MGGLLPSITVRLPDRSIRICTPLVKVIYHNFAQLPWELEPVIRFELILYGLQIRCVTIAPNRRG